MDTTPELRTAVHSLVASGRFEFVDGGIVQHDQVRHGNPCLLSLLPLVVALTARPAPPHTA